MSYRVPATNCRVDPIAFMSTGIHPDEDSNGNPLCHECIYQYAASASWLWINDEDEEDTDVRFDHDIEGYANWRVFMNARTITGQVPLPGGHVPTVPQTAQENPNGLTFDPRWITARPPGPLAGRIELNADGQPVFVLNLTDERGNAIPATVQPGIGVGGVPPPTADQPRDTAGAPAVDGRTGVPTPGLERANPVQPLSLDESRYAPPRSFPTARSTAETRESYNAALSLVRDAAGMARIRSLLPNVDFHLSFATDHGVAIFTQEPRNNRPLICHEIDINRVAALFRQVDDDSQRTQAAAINYPAITLLGTHDLRVEQVANDWLQIYQRFPAKDTVIRVQLPRLAFRRELTPAEIRTCGGENSSAYAAFQAEQARKNTRETWRGWWSRFIESSVGGSTTAEDAAHDFIRVSLPERIWVGRIARRQYDGWAPGSIPFNGSRLLLLDAAGHAGFWIGGNGETPGTCCWGQGERAVMRIEDLDNIFFESQFNTDLQRDSWNWLNNPATRPTLFPAGATRIPATALMSYSSALPTSPNDMMTTRRAPAWPI